MHNTIIQNLIDYQKQTAQATGLPVIEKHGLFSVQNVLGSWPRTTIGTVDMEKIPAVVLEIDNQQMAPFWVMDNEISVNQIEYLEKNGFREVNRWEGMLLKKDSFTLLDRTKDDLQISQVGSDTIQDWYQIVKEVMLPNKSISNEILDYWLSCNDVTLFVGKTEDRTVAAGMSFTYNKIAGLYFIATLPEFRGKGYATILVEALIEKCFREGVDEVVLHASEMGCSIYQKLGFTKEGPISTYWKIGRF